MINETGIWYILFISIPMMFITGFITTCYTETIFGRVDNFKCNSFCFVVSLINIIVSSITIYVWANILAHATEEEFVEYFIKSLGVMIGLSILLMIITCIMELLWGVKFKDLEIEPYKAILVNAAIVILFAFLISEVSEGSNIHTQKIEYSIENKVIDLSDLY